jgi:FkbM family methyltransferase
MSLLGRIARAVGGAVGRDSAIINAVRPVYDRFADWSTLGRGIRHRVNHEEFRIDPHYRAHVPEIYDPEVASYLRDHVNAGDVSLVIGAHVGIYVLSLAKWSAPGGHVYAFEPNPATRAILRKHVRLNDAVGAIDVVGYAVSAAPGEATFCAYGIEGFSRLGVPNPEVRADPTALTVSVTTVDAFCAERTVMPDWITVDVEGYEAAVLAGARDTIAAGRGRLGIIVEMHPNLWEAAGSSRAAMDALLTSLSLTGVPMTGQAAATGDYGIIRLAYDS